MTETPDLFGHAPKKKRRPTGPHSTRKFEFDGEGNVTRAECTRCEELLPLSGFSKCKTALHGINNWCKSCSRWSKIYRIHGLTRQEWEHMYAHQSGKCYICKHSLDGGRRPNVDHCHVTNKVVSLLCHFCNTGLGNAGENPEILLAMAEYAKKHKVAKKELGDTDDGF